MGKKIVLTGTELTDLSAPTLATYDPIESEGSLLLLEPAHPYVQWGAGVPANDAALPNIVSAILDTGDPTFALQGGINNNTKGKLERSAKGGLHGFVSQANALSAGDGAQVVISTKLLNYIAANAAHHFYVSCWDRLTRVNGNSGSAYAYEYTFGTAGANGLVTMTGNANVAVPAGGAIMGGPRQISNTIGPRCSSAAVSPAVLFSGSRPSGPVWGAPTGGFNAAVIGTRNSYWPSFLFYRFYVEDLTVSGRTYAEVDAIDYALFDKHVLTTGGRYYGDTFTDPATLV